jgi:hypothetical protein
MSVAAGCLASNSFFTPTTSRLVLRTEAEGTDAATAAISGRQTPETYRCS